MRRKPCVILHIMIMLIITSISISFTLKDDTEFVVSTIVTNSGSSVQFTDVNNNLQQITIKSRFDNQKIKGIYNLSTDMNYTIKGVNSQIYHYSFAIGDINNDGKDDIIIGDFLMDGLSRQDAGVVYVIFGASRAKIESITSLSDADVIIYGADEHNRAGRSVLSGDLDNDGFDDILINTYDEEYIIFGRPREEFGSIIDLNESTSYSHGDVMIVGGQPVSIADINGDDFDDVVFIDPDWNYSRGRVQVKYGSNRDDIGKNIILPDDADITINGHDAYSHLGWSAYAADITNDNKAEIFLEYLAGGIYGIYGSDDLPAVIDLDPTTGNFQVNFTLLNHDNDGSYIYTSGDINGDKYNDLIIGESSDYRAVVPPDVSETHGKVHVLYGRDELPTYIDLSLIGDPHAEILIKGDEVRDALGFSVAVGDIDRNGKADIITGANQANGMDNLKHWSGETYLIYGRIKEKFNAFYYASQIADVTFYGAEEEDFSGDSVVSGDIDGDGTDDIIIGSTVWQSTSEKRDIYIKYGIPTGYGIEMGLEDDYHIVGRGETTEFHITVSNNGRYDDIFDFMMVDVPDNWDAKLNSESLSFKFGELKQIVLTVTAPDDVRHNDWANITVYGISRGDDTVSAFVTARTQMVIPVGVELECFEKGAGIIPLTSKNYTINITNLGSFEDEFEIALSDAPQGWKARSKPQYVYLEPFKSSKFNLTVTHTNISSPEFEFEIEVRAISLYDPKINSALNLTTFTNTDYKLNLMILNTDAHKVKPGTATNYTFKISNVGKYSCNANISYFNNEPDWNVILSNDSFHLKRYEWKIFNLTVRSPEDSIENDRLEVIVEAAILEKPFLKYRNITTTVVSYENELFVNYNDLYCYGFPGNYTSVNFSITNTGASDFISFIPVELPVGWQLEFIPSSLFLNTNETGMVDVSIFIGEDALNENYQIKFEPVSGDFSLLMNINVYVNQTFGISFENDRYIVDIMPGRNFTVSVTIRNTGNGFDTISFRPKGEYSGWIELDHYIFDLFADESKLITANITCPSDIGIDTYNIELTANSSLDPETIESIVILCMVSKPDLYLSIPPVEESVRVQGEYAFRVTVYNHGRINISEEIKVQLKVDGQLIAEQVLTIIPGDSEKLIVMRWYSQGGSHTLTFIVDPDNTIPETNEFNNTVTFSMEISSESDKSQNKTSIMFSVSIFIIIVIILTFVFLIYYRRKKKQYDEKLRVSIIEPQNGGSISGLAAIKGNVSDESIHEIYLHLDSGDNIKVNVENKEWSYALDTAKLDNGEHKISVKPKMIGKDMEPVNITVNIDNK
ncbi:MAG: FG-GAP repeat protein [Thermoplasmata archaeon]|nr:MAG: FG-GAP repeat protein [Thermoplasmata archaeon]